MQTKTKVIAAAIVILSLASASYLVGANADQKTIATVAINQSSKAKDQQETAKAQQIVKSSKTKKTNQNKAKANQATRQNKTNANQTSNNNLHYYKTGKRDAHAIRVANYLVTARAIQKADSILCDSSLSNSDLAHIVVLSKKRHVSLIEAKKLYLM